ncbi:MAG: AbrB/MazE/SpoVT family DNA-binding domain-containing protein [Clostridiales Family XIII bacterium]|jgi:transcriptional pleiotropic regulator of transition state genes|nr:AbrB/MazE/SpoVT family DNA-binding domain-containing protein [Clostridiales Family XIII bacterium]
MKATGIVRKVDELGRIVLPMELRRTLNIQKEDPIEIYVDGESIILRKYEPACIFCSSATEVSNIRGKNICRKCLEEIKEL